MDISLKTLVDKLNDVTRKGVQEAMSLALSRTNHAVEIEHLLYALATNDGTDLSPIFRQFDINPGRVGTDLIRTIDRFKTGSARNSLAFSPRIPQALQEAWLFASLENATTNVRSGHILVALLANPETRQLLFEASNEFRKIQLETLRSHFGQLIARSGETAVSTNGETNPNENTPAKTSSKTQALDQFTVDLTEQARSGKIDPVLGRDMEIRQVIDILTRRRKNNPILTGEPGVGKTAVVEGLALRIVAGDVPDPLKSVSLRVLDLGSLQAGAGVKGEFESRLKGVIDEVKTAAKPIILFIDEAHMLIGAGNQAGQGDAANLLKPALARGELRTIAATTWSEYKKYFEKDAALERRFQVVKVDEPTVETAVTMIRGLVERMEEHHNVRVLDEAVQDAVRLSHKFITARQLPDKAVDVLDTSCGRVAMAQAATPALIEQAQKRIEECALEIRSLAREIAAGADHSERLTSLNARSVEAKFELESLKGQYEREKALVERIQKLRAELEQANCTTAVANGSQNRATCTRAVELESLQKELIAIQGERPLVHPCVTSQTIAEVISSWTGIPVGRMLSDQIQTVLTLEEKLEERVVGQGHALETISERIRMARSHLTDPKRPVGVFLLLGPSGVGKTETAKTLAEELFGGERKLITINMSEYQEKHTVSLLKGAPPGYVGYGQGGVLTEAVRRKPYSVVLLDEVEKAHRDVLELFYKVFDEGMIEDSEGRDINFRNTVILLTSNLGSDVFMELCADPEKLPTPEELVEAVRPELVDFFAPALLGRMTIVPYYPLSDETMKGIIKLQLGRISERISENYGATFTYDEALVGEVIRRCKEADSGARNIDRILSGTVLPDLARTFLGRMADSVAISSVHIGLQENGAFACQVN